ncbi:hypothetical protein L1987_72837 [Smallanthus sonchifolius]|uniref:Uncharacterized protein n=1 Tax=Smallanthus sonchifolius TaxID=185202 RepID=A0ACB9AX76_9ASTR|nr:hypothetical protein L1987_72837 [Smallanthus sonchifolius]
MGIPGNSELTAEPETTIRGAFTLLMANLNISDDRPVIPMSVSEPSAFPCFSTSHIASDAIAEAVQSTDFNGYPAAEGILPARRAVAEYLSQDLPNKLSPDDVFMTMGCQQAALTILHVLGGSKLNILLPKPCFPYYDVFAQTFGLEIRFFDLLSEKHWEVDLDSVIAVADENTVGMVIINPGNPCGNVFTYSHLKKVHMCRRSYSLLISFLIIRSIKQYFHISPYPPSFIQGALPHILAKTDKDFFSSVLNIIKDAANSCYEGLKDIPGVTCPTRPEGSMCLLVKLDISMFEDIKDDLDFCIKLAKEESVMILPGISVGLPNWLRVTFAIDPSYLEDGIKRLKSFCERHSKRA